MPYSVSAVPPEMVDAVWPGVLPMIRRGISRVSGGDLTPETIRTAVISGDMHMWAIHENDEVAAVVVFRILQRLHGRVLYVVMLAGRDMDNWIHELIRLLMDFKDIAGAMSMQATCRLGLAKYLADLGWKRKAIIMEAPDGQG